MSDNIGDRVREARQKRGLSQPALAKLCGYSDKSAICKIEKGGRNFPLDKVEVIARALGVSAEWLLWGSEAHDMEPSLAGKKAVLIEYINQMNDEDIDKFIKVVEIFSKG